MNNQERRTTRIMWSFVLLAAVYVFWLLFTLVPTFRDAQTHVSALLPRWYVVVNLVLVPVLFGLAATPRRISFPVRFMLCALAMASLIVADLAASVFVGANFAMTVVLLIEAYWLIPKWKARRRSSA